MAPHADGFLVAWQSFGPSDPDSTIGIRARQARPFQYATGAEFQVNSYTTSTQQKPRVAGTADGAALVTWESEGSAGSDPFSWSIQARAFDAGTTPLGDDLQVKTSTLFHQALPAATAGPDGDFLVVWTSPSSGDDIFDDSLQAQRLELFIFADGFESGDTTAWSTTNP